ncbi:hypothetical protein ABNG03_10020 [Halorubrum sp. RMP-47]|uniref:Uncharacterized protein n=1 Tax=Halorubrum miltondacostae TaxID=3076378 RepID=A0ABD5LW97_9EURY
MPPTCSHDGRISQRDVDSGTGLDGPPIDGLGGGTDLIDVASLSRSRFERGEALDEGNVA